MKEHLPIIDNIKTRLESIDKLIKNMETNGLNAPQIIDGVGTITPLYNDGAIALYFVDAEANSIMELHFHKLSDEFFYILKGRGKVEVDGEVKDFSENDFIEVRRGVFHRVTHKSYTQYYIIAIPPLSEVGNG